MLDDQSSFSLDVGYVFELEHATGEKLESRKHEQKKASYIIVEDDLELVGINLQVGSLSERGW